MFLFVMNSLQPKNLLQYEASNIDDQNILRWAQDDIL